MKKVIFIVTAILICGIASAQPGRIPQVEPPPEGFKPSSCNTFLSQYPAVNVQTRQAMFRVVAPTAHKVQADLAGKRYDMTKNEQRGLDMHIRPSGCRFSLLFHLDRQRCCYGPEYRSLFRQ